MGCVLEGGRYEHPVQGECELGQPEGVVVVVLRPCPTGLEGSGRGSSCTRE